MGKSRGFSLIELVVVIVVLGILAVTALPRFLDVTEEAKNASVEGVAGGYATAVLLVRSQWEAKGRVKEVGRNTIVYDGNRFYLTTPTKDEEDSGELSPGYPMDTNASATPDVNPGNLSATRCLNIWNGLLQNPPKATQDFSLVEKGDNSLKFYVSVEQSGNDSLCRYYLINSLSKNAAGNYEDPQNRTDRYKSFSYRPASGQVVTHINN